MLSYALPPSPAAFPGRYVFINRTQLSTLQMSLVVVYIRGRARTIKDPGSSAARPPLCLLSSSLIKHTMQKRAGEHIVHKFLSASAAAEARSASTCGSTQLHVSARDGEQTRRHRGSPVPSLPRVSPHLNERSQMNRIRVKRSVLFIQLNIQMTASRVDVMYVTVLLKQMDTWTHPW